MSVYSASFYAEQSSGSVTSARVVVPYVVSLTRPASVVDVGCGIGTWLTAFREQGVATILGMDGDYVDVDSLLIPRECFQPRDLTKPTGITDRFDLAISLEVAEHLPPESGEGFVDELVRLADMVLFSAAIPGQGGTNHVNERWQSYWRGLFEQRGYAPVDCVRPKFWTDSRIVSCYRQNTILYVKQSVLDQRPDLQAEAERTAATPFDMVHPELFVMLEQIRARQRINLRRLLTLLPGAAAYSVKWHLGIR